MGVWYACREDVQRALDVEPTPRVNAQIDRLVEAASRSVENQLHRLTIAPTITTRYFDWPSKAMGTSWRLWLDGDTLISPPTTVTSGGTTIPAATVPLSDGYWLEPANEGPPFNRLEMNLGGSSSWDTGPTQQRNIAITGLFGYSDESVFVGYTNGTFSSSNDIAQVVADPVGVGSVLRINDERMICLDRAMVSTSRSLSADLTDKAADTLVQTDGSTIYPGETILIDSERMLVTDTSGNNLVVKRAWAGTALASHTSATAIYSLRAFRVQRGALGTTATTHVDGGTWTAWVVPGPIRTLTIAEVINAYAQETSGYNRTIGSGDAVRNALGGGIEDIRASTFQSHGRKARSGVVV